MQKNVTCLVDTPSATDSGYDWPSAPSGQLVPLQWRCGFAFRPTGFHVSERLHSYCEAFRTHACAGWSPKSSCKTAPRGETSVAIQWSPRCPEVSDRGSYDGHLGLLGEIDMGRSTFAAVSLASCCSQQPLQTLASIAKTTCIECAEVASTNRSSAWVACNRGRATTHLRVVGRRDA